MRTRSNRHGAEQLRLDVLPRRVHGRAALESALKSKSGNLDGESIRQAFRTLKIPGEATIAPFRSIEFDAHGRNSGAQFLIAQWHDGATRSASASAIKP